MADTPSRQLAAIRRRIDEIDGELIRLLNERAACAVKVAEVKLAEPPDAGGVPDGAAASFYRPEREAQVLARVRRENPGPLADADVVRLFREVMSMCLALEQPLAVAYLGPEGTFSEAAAIKHFGSFVHARPLSSIDEIFREVEAGTVHFGIVPVENSTEGPINLTLDRLMTSPLRICGEVELPIHHCLIAAAGTSATAIERIYSHQQSLAQCRRWLDTRYPGIACVAVGSNGEAAMLAAAETGTAAVAGKIAAERYGLTILASRIEDHPDNRTRFLIIGRQGVPPSGRDKTSILVSTRNEPGALFRVLEPFHRYGISLTRIETRPSKTGSWSYVFFIDFDGHADASEIGRVLDEVAAVSIEVRTLGSYPQAAV
jgi:chorismate mutase / prephenate dehydratase